MGNFHISEPGVEVLQRKATSMPHVDADSSECTTQPNTSRIKVMPSSERHLGNAIHTKGIVVRKRLAYG